VNLQIDSSKKLKNAGLCVQTVTRSEPQNNRNGINMSQVVLKAINCTGGFSFGLCKTIPLENIGCVFINGVNEDHGGGSCGAGKSSILNLIKEILFERNDTGKSGPNIVNKHKEWGRGCFLVLWLKDRHNKLWRLMVLRKWKGLPPDATISSEPSEILSRGEKYTGSDLFIERWDGERWRDERPTSMVNKTTQTAKDKIRNEILGMSYDQFSAYVCLGQQAESSLVMGTGGEREKIIQAVVDVSIWDAAAASVRTLISSKETALSQSSAKIAGMESAISAITVPTPQAIADIQVRCSGYEAECGQLNRELATTLSAEKLVELELQKSEGEIEGLKQELDVLVAEERHSNERLQTFALPKPPHTIQELTNTCAILQDTINRNNNTIKSYTETRVGQCSSCGQQITKEYLDKEIDRLVATNAPLVLELENTNEKCWMMISEYETSNEKLKAEAKAKYDNEIVHIKEARAKLVDRLAQPMSMKGKLEAARSASILAQTKLRAKENEYASTISILKGMQMRESEYHGLMATKDRVTVELASLNEEIQHLGWVERNLKKVKLTEYEAAIDRLNLFMNEELHKVWGPGLNARFVTAQDKARGGVKQELELMVYSPKKEEVPIELYSGGEKKTVIIAVFKAMSRLARERGLSVNLAAIDEIDKDLDEVGTDRLVEAFESIASDNSSCIVISHNSRLLNTMNFDDVWTVRKTNEFSTIEIGSKAQEKAA
jgi:DNA repair exonuclease SbcCD ATPase subunit